MIQTAEDFRAAVARLTPKQQEELTARIRKALGAHLTPHPSPVTPPR